MIKVVVLVRRRGGLTLRQFHETWLRTNPPLVRALPGVRGYVQSHTIQRRAAPAWDGAAELWFDDIGAAREALSSPQADRLRESERAFIGDLEWFLAEEFDCLPRGPARPSGRSTNRTQGAPYD